MWKDDSDEWEVAKKKEQKDKRGSRFEASAALLTKRLSWYDAMKKENSIVLVLFLFASDSSNGLIKCPCVAVSKQT